MEEKINQKKLIKIAEKENIRLNDRIINYYINLNLLPKPVKTRDESVTESNRAENVFDLDHTIFMLEILKKISSLGFKKTSQAQNILGGGRYTIYEELMYIIYDLNSRDICEEAILNVSSASVRVNDRLFTDVARHCVILENDEVIDDYPFFPNYDLWHFVSHKRQFKDKYCWVADWQSKTEYFEIKVPSSKKFDRKEYVNENFSRLYFNSSKGD